MTQRTRSWFVRAGLALLVATFVAVFSQKEFLQWGVLERLELTTLDYRFQFRGPSTTIKDSSHVVIVEITDDSFRSLSARFPWPRSYYAHVLRNLKAAGARVVGIDLLFGSPDTYSAKDDQELADALRETGLGVLAGKRESDSESFIKTSVAQDYGNIFFPGESGMGLVNIRNDPDGVYRGYNVFFVADAADGNERALPTLAFAVLNKYFGLPPLTVPQPAGDVFHYADKAIPRRDAGSLLVNFYGPNGTFPHMRFNDVIDDASLTTAEEESSGEQINTFSDSTYGYLFDGTFKDKIVLIGVTVPEYKDLFPVSVARGEKTYGNMMYGVEIHANVIESILRGEFLTLQSMGSEIGMITLLVVVTFFVTSALRELKTRHYALVAFLGFLVAVVEVIAISVAALWLFASAGYVLSVISAMIAIVAGHVVSTTYHYVTERKERLLIKSMFSTYLSPSLVDELVVHPEKLVLGGQRQELTVLFSDIEGFTSISQSMEPERLVSILNEYLSLMSAIIFRNYGTLDKYEGDAIMAFWGAPVPQANHALGACLSALEMQDALGEMNRQWKKHGRPAIRVRMGINTGDMVVGNMGSSGKFAYTVIGDSVNLASRLEGANKEYRTSIMVSERTYQLVRETILGRRLDRIAVRGRTESVTSYELLQRRDQPLPDDLRHFLPLYEEGMRLYDQHAWSAARQVFEKALTYKRDDFPTVLHVERCRQFELSPPPADWDGVSIIEKM